MNHIVIATPMYGGMCTGNYVQSALGTLAVGSQYETALSFSFLFNESLIQRARNLLVHQFLKLESATHLMFIDADIKWNPHDVFLMMQKDVDIICGLYPKKEINWNNVAWAAKNNIPTERLKDYTGSVVVNLLEAIGPEGVKSDEPLPINNGGTGFMLIKRRVFEKLAKKVKKYRNDVNILSHEVITDEIAEFFPVYIEKESQRLLSEDYAFCQIARKAGFTIHAAPWVQLGHFGSYLFEGGMVPASDVQSSLNAEKPRRSGSRSGRASSRASRASGGD